MKRILLIFCLTWNLHAFGATQRVPSRMSLGDIQLKLTAAGKKRIQARVDALTQSPKYLQSLIDLANLFLPIVERVLQEENIPPDFKYLVIQESKFIADAVSTSNAVGFWQFKDFTATEVGLQMNKHVDERMHIATATRGAARYLKSHNQRLDNWLYSMLAYQQGRGYVERNIDYKKYQGAKKMRIDDKTHWYIIHFLGYKLALEDKVGKELHPELYLHEYEEAQGKTLDELAQEFGVAKKRLKKYNKWLKRHRVPHDTTCATIIPLTHEQYAKRQAPKPQQVIGNHKLDYAKYRESATNFPVLTTRRDKKTNQELTWVNGIRGRVAQAEDGLDTLAQAGNISVKRLLAFNDMAPQDAIVPGQVYYFSAKKRKAGIHFHIARPGETWWSISQQYGIQKRQLLLKNRLRKEVELRPWRVLWLRFIRPAKIPVAYEYATEEKQAPIEEKSGLTTEVPLPTHEEQPNTESTTVTETPVPELDEEQPNITTSAPEAPIISESKDTSTPAH